MLSFIFWTFLGIIGLLIIVGVIVCVTYKYVSYKKDLEKFNDGYCPICGFPYRLNRFSQYHYDTRIYVCSNDTCRKLIAISNRKVDHTEDCE